MAWKPRDTEALAEIERLNRLIDHYEAANLSQRQELDLSKAAYADNIKRIQTLEREKKGCNKSIKTLEGRLKFDKFAADGIKKKFNLLEVDVSELKYDIEKLTIERSQDKIRIKELEEDLNRNRADKLRLMHENTILRHQNEDLVSKESSAAADALEARNSLLTRLQDLDNTMHTSEAQGKTIDLQAEESIALTREVYHLKEKVQRLNQQLLDHDQMTGEYNRTIDALQNEISRLRKELVLSADNANNMSDWYISRAANKVSTTIANSTYSSDTEGPFSIKRRPYTETGSARDRNHNSNFNSSSSSSTNAMDNSVNMSRTIATAQVSKRSSNVKRSRHFNTAPAATDGGLSLVTSPLKPAAKQFSNTLPSIAPTAFTATATATANSISNTTTVATTTVAATTSVANTTAVAASTDSHHSHYSPNSHSTSKYKYIELRDQAVAMKDSLELQLPAGGSQQQLRHDVMAEQSDLVRDFAVSQHHHQQQQQCDNSHSILPASRQQTRSQQQHQFKRSEHNNNNNNSGSRSNVRKQYNSGRIVLSPAATPNRPVAALHSINSTTSSGTTATVYDPTVSRASTATAANVASSPEIANLASRIGTSAVTVRFSEWSAATAAAAAASVGEVDRCTAADSVSRIKKLQKCYSITSSGSINKPNKKSTKSSNKRSLYVSSGLGFRHNVELDQELANLNNGTAKEVIRRVLGDRLDEDGNLVLLNS